MVIFNKEAGMPIQEGTRYVLVLKRDRDGKWYRKRGGRGKMAWLPIDGHPFEVAANREKLLDIIK